MYIPEHKKLQMRNKNENRNTLARSLTIAALTKQTFLIDEMIAMEQFKLLKLNNIIYYKSQK